MGQDRGQWVRTVVRTNANELGQGSVGQESGLWVKTWVMGQDSCQWVRTVVSGSGQWSMGPVKGDGSGQR